MIVEEGSSARVGINLENRLGPHGVAGMAEFGLGMRRRQRCRVGGMNAACKLSAAMLAWAMCLFLGADARGQGATPPPEEATALLRHALDAPSEDMAAWDAYAGVVRARPIDRYLEGTNPCTFGSRLLKESKAVTDDILDRGLWRVDVNYEAMALGTIPDWSANPPNNRNWGLNLHALSVLQLAVQASRDTGDTGYLARWKPILLDYIAKNPRGATPPTQAWSDHAVSERTVQLIYYAEHLRRSEAMDAAFLRAFVPFLMAHGEALANPAEYIARHNHGFFQDKALLLLTATWPELPQASVWRELAGARVKEQFEYFVDEEGIHVEHSSSYHVGLYVQWLHFRRMLAAYAIAIPFDLDGMLARMRPYIGWLALPQGGGALPRIGNTRRKTGVGASRVADDPEAAYSLSGGTVGTAPTARMRVWPKSGIAIFRDGWHAPERFRDSVHLLFWAAFLSATHKHGDDMSYMLAGYGTEWIVDSGGITYKRDSWEDRHLVGNTAHTTLLFGGRPTPRDAASAAGRPLTMTGWGETADGLMWAEAESRQLPDVVWRRRIAYRRPHLIQVLDRFEADAETPWTSLIQFDEGKDVALDGAARVLTVTNPGDPGVVLKLRLTELPPEAAEVPPWLESGAISGGTSEVKLYKGNRDPDLGWRSTDEGTVVPASTAVWFGNARRGTLLTEITFEVAPDRALPEVP